MSPRYDVASVSVRSKIPNTSDDREMERLRSFTEVYFGGYELRHILQIAWLTLSPSMLGMH